MTYPCRSYLNQSMILGCGSVIISHSFLLMSLLCPEFNASSDIYTGEIGPNNVWFISVQEDGRYNGLSSDVGKQLGQRWFM